jgi:hypothetical protein
VFLAILNNEYYDRLVNPELYLLIIVGLSIDITLLELANSGASVVGYEGRFVSDNRKLFVAEQDHSCKQERQSGLDRYGQTKKNFMSHTNYLESL